jgi:dipeptidyl aminopeptidase/acylaminoacyl peptidase
VIAFWHADRLWMMNADGTRKRPIASNHFENGGASLAPSGQVVAETNIAGSTGRGGVLVLRRAGGRVLKRFRFRTASAEGFGDPVWAPDNQVVAWDGIICEGGDSQTLCTDRSEIFVSNLRNRVRSISRVRSRQDEAPAWSPDARRIAFVTCGKDFSCQLATIRPDGSGRRVIRRIEAGTYFVEPVWAPDGGTIALALRFGPTGPSKTVPAPQRYGIYVMRPDGSAFRRVGKTPMMASLGISLAWAPDSRRIAFADTRGISVVDINTRSQRRVTSLGRGSGVAWTPSAWILFTHRGDIYKMFPAGRPMRVTP